MRVSRFILANTEQLHDKIKVMSDRIRELETGLQEVQLKVSSDKHPLLREELLTIKKSPDLFGLEQQGSHHDTAQDVSPKASTSTSVSPRAQSTGGDEVRRMRDVNILSDIVLSAHSPARSSIKHRCSYPTRYISAEPRVPFAMDDITGS